MQYQEITMILLALCQQAEILYMCFNKILIKAYSPSVSLGMTSIHFFSAHEEKWICKFWRIWAAFKKLIFCIENISRNVFRSSL